MRLVNYELLVNPANWLVVFLMLAFATIVIAMISKPWGDANA